MSRFDSVFFDSGGTLYGVFDGQNAPTPAQVADGRFERIAHALRAHGANVGNDLEAAIRACEIESPARWGAGYNFHHLMVAVLERLRLPLGNEVAACLANDYAGPRYAAWLYPGTERMLRELSEAGLHLGIIANTAWPSFCMDRAFAGVGLLPYLRTRVYSGDEGIEKPDPALFHLAARVSGQTGRRILYVGNDLQKDIAGAKAVGWSAALRRSTVFGSNGLADFEFDRSEELVAYVLDT